MIQRALNGTSNLSEVVEPATAERTPDTAKPEGQTFEGSFHVVSEQPDTPRKASARQKTAQPDQAQTTAPRKPFTAGQNGSGLGDLLRGKLSGFQGLNTSLASSAVAIPEGATFNSGSFTNQSGSRDYKLYIPSGYHGQSLPLVVMLHGCTQNPDDFAAGTGMNTLAEDQLCLVLYPAQTASANQSKCWNWFKPSDQKRESGEPAILAGMTRQIIDEYKLDEQRVYVAGLSAGGAMATALAMTHPDLYAAVGVHSGLPHGAANSIPSALAAMRGDAAPLASRKNKRAGAGATSSVPAIIFHGDRDTTVHPGNGDRVVAQYSGSVGSGNVSKNATDVKSAQGRVPNGHAYTRTTQHDANGKAIVEQWSIHGAGHAWAGGSSQGSYTDPKGPDASGEMLRFFLTHSKTERR